MEAKTIRENSVEIAKTVRGIGVAIHRQCMVIAKHIGETEDVTIAWHFVSLLQNKDNAIVRADAVKNWFEAFGFCRFGKTKDGKDGFKLNRSAFDSVMQDNDERSKHFKTAMSNPWNKFTKAKALQSFDLETIIKSAIERADKAKSEPSAFKSVKIDDDKLSKLREMFAA